MFYKTHTHKSLQVVIGMVSILLWDLFSTLINVAAKFQMAIGKKKVHKDFLTLSLEEGKQCMQAHVKNKIKFHD